MINYQDLKEKISDNRNKLTLALCFVLVFVAGLGTGRGVQQNKKSTSSLSANYTAKTAQKPAAPEAAEPAEKPNTAPTLKTPVAGGSCPVKGNISANSKIYHVKGGAFYEKVKPEQCFNTEQEAKDAGFRKSAR